MTQDKKYNIIRDIMGFTILMVGLSFISFVVYITFAPTPPQVREWEQNIKKE